MRLLIKIILLSSVLALTGCGKKEDLYKGMNDEQIYNRGKQFALKENYSKAIKDYEAIEARYPYGIYTEKALLGVIHAYFESEDWASALIASDRFIRMYPRHVNVDYAYYMKGMVGYHQNYSLAFRLLPLDRSMRSNEFARQGFEDFRTFVQKFPDSKYAPDARKRMIVLREQLANHDLHVAKHYMKQNAYVAAANRGADIVTNFSQTSAAPKALLVMHDAYAKMGMHDLAEKTMKALESNFPDYHENSR